MSRILPIVIVPFNTKTKVILLAASLSAMVGLVIATSYFKRRRRGQRQRPSGSREPVQQLPIRDSHELRKANGPRTIHKVLASPQVESPKGFARLSRSSSRKSIMTAIASRASYSMNDSRAGSVNSLPGDIAGSSHSGQRTPTNESSVSIQRLFQLGMEAFDNAISCWEDAVDLVAVQDIDETQLSNTKAASKSELTHSLGNLLSSAYRLQEDCEEAAVSMPNLAFTASEMRELAEELSIMREGRKDEDDEETSSNDSFVSATENEDLDSFNSSSSDLQSPTSSTSSRARRRNELYDTAVMAVGEGVVECRRIRSKMLHCRGDEDFLAKLHCVRLAMAVLLEDQSVADWFVSMGKQLIADLLVKANYDTEEFNNVFDDMMAYVRDENNYKEIETELRARKVRFLSFYDVVLDFLLLDAFDDLEDPPASITCVTRNRWLSNRVKESAISTAVWSVLAAKRRMLKNPNGFLSKVYLISYHVTPALAWGFLGSDQSLRELMEFFKDQVLGFSRDMFSLRKCRYIGVSEFADDILALAKLYSAKVSEKLAS